MALWDEVSANDKKGLFRSDDNTTSYPTGLLVLDYANGSWIEITNEKGEKKLYPH